MLKKLIANETPGNHSSMAELLVKLVQEFFFRIQIQKIDENVEEHIFSSDLS